jgi:A/G-specific adenine glycosylase
MPWVGERDPYRIWLSEVILQQTTVRQGRAYYDTFCKALPNIAALSRAREDKVLRLWQGLGYYNRARNMHKTSKIVTRKFGSRFPTSYEELLDLPGIGAYTAAAISSFAANEPRPVVDGNVSRCLARYCGVRDPIDSRIGKLAIARLASAFLDPVAPGRYNQALMNFGSQQCRRHNPECAICPLRNSCIARSEGLVQTLPLKSSSKPKRVRYFNYLVVRVKGRYLLRKRTGRDIWNGLYEFPLIETPRRVSMTELSRRPEWTRWRRFVLGSAEPTKTRQVLTHQTIDCQLLEMTGTSVPADYISVTAPNLDRFPKPRVLSWYLELRRLY